MNLTNLWDRAIKRSVFDRSVDGALGAIRQAVRPFGQPHSAPPQPCPVRRAAALVVLGLLALALPEAAQAQPVRTLISNFIGTVAATENVPVTATFIVGQGFTTGPNFTGYGLDSIRVHFQTVATAPTNFTASIWTTQNSPSLGTTGDNTGTPLAKLFDLINPTDITTAGDKIFTAPANTTLNRDTTYAVVFETTDGQIALDIRASRTEEGDALAWSIIDFHYLKVSATQWSIVSEPTPLRIEVKGTGPDRPDDSPALKVEVTSEPRSMAAGSSTPDTYGLGETIVITAIAGVPVTVAGDPVFRFLLTNPDEADNIIRQATYDATRSRGRAFAFAYTVQADDRDTDGIEVRDHTRTFLLDEDDRIFTTSQNIDIDRTYEHTIAYKPAEPQGDRLPNHKVDGSLAPAVTVPQHPTRPTLASATTTTLTVEWTHPGDGGSPLLRNAVRYRLLQVIEWTNVDVGTTPVTHAVITNLQPNTRYEVQVQAINASGASLWASGISAFKTPTNTAPTGAPSITGTAALGQQLTASTTGISDADGLPSSFSYQWVRVDADGTSNPVNIPGETTATYTLTTADVGKRIRVRVSFTDNLGNPEMLTSAAYPSSGTVTAPATAACAVPSLSGRNVIWTGAMTVAVNPANAGVFGFESGSFGTLDDQTFTVGANDYTTRLVSLMGNALTFATTNSDLTAGEKAELRLHVCAADLDFSAATGPTVDHAYLFSTTGLSWLSGDTVTLRLSVPGFGGAPLGVPQNFSATAGDTRVVLSWTAPASDGGTAITTYQYRYSAGSTVDTSATWTDVPDGADTDTDAGNETTFTVTDLTNGTQYAFEVRAVNSGDGPAATDTATPQSPIIPPIIPPSGTTTGSGSGGGGGSARDEHGNTPAQATPVTLDPTRTASVPGRLNTAADVDYFSADVPHAGVLVVETSGSTATMGTVWQAGEELATADSGGVGQNFRLSVRVAPGSVVIAVAGNGQQTGAYTLQVTSLPGFLENPGAASFQSGIGVISGWVCDAEEVEIVLNGEPQEAAYGTARLDTAGVCGDADNGFGLLFNWNLLGDGAHTVVAVVDGVELDRATVTVTTLGAEFLRDVTGTCTAADFPTGDETVTLAWQQTQQNFVIVDGPAPAGANRAGTPGVGYLENPGTNSFQSGIGVLSGWVCEGAEVIIELNGEPQPAAYGTARLDTLEMCGDTANGFGLLFNWNLLGEGAHEVVAFVDGEELGRATVRVTTLGEEFVRDVEGECVVEDFPMPGETVTLEWQQNSQNFVIIETE